MLRAIIILLLVILMKQAHSAADMSERRFDFIIGKFEHVYAPIVESHGGRLDVQRIWESDFNYRTSARRDASGKVWTINITGDVARHKSVTEDGLALILCHEMGHHLGGLPLKVDKSGNERWATAEEGADYFATLKCLRKIFKYDDNKSVVKKLWPHPFIIKSCNEAHRDERDVWICVRSLLAAKAVSGYLAERGHVNQTYLQSPESLLASLTNLSYGTPQCRLDTFFQGALCDADEREELSYTDITKGSCHPSLGSALGNRPSCWYKF